MEAPGNHTAGLLRDLLESLETLVWLAEPGSLRLRYANRQGAARLGYSAAAWEKDGYPWSALVHPDDREEMKLLCAEVARDGHWRERVHRLIDGSGGARWFKTRVVRQVDGDARVLFGQTAEVVGPPPRDEPEPGSDAWLRIVQQLPVVVWTVDRELRFTSGSGAGLKSLGLRPDQLVGLSLNELIGVRGPDAPEVAEHLRALKGDSVHYQDTWGGRVFDIRVEPLRDGSGGIIGVAGIALDVTEQARSQDRYRQIVETAEEGIWMIDAEGLTTFVNRKMAELLGCSIDDMMGRSFLDFMDESMRAVALGNMRRRAQGIRERHEFRLKRRDGEDVWVLMSTSPIHDEAGVYRGALAMSVDITEQRRVEAERELLLRDLDLRRLELELVFKHAPLGILLLRGKDFVVEVANPMVQAMMPGRQIEGRRWYEDVAPELAEVFRPQVEEAMRTGQPQHVVDATIPVRRTPDGPVEQAWVTSSRIPIDLPDGERGMLLMFFDTTAMVRARDEISRLAAVSARQAAQLKAILDSMTDAVVAYDADGRVSYANQACSQMLGLALAHDESPAPEQLLPLFGAGDSLEAIPSRGQLVESALAGETVAEREVTLPQGTHRGALVLRTGVVPLRDAEGRNTGAILVSRDVTARAEFERLQDEFIGVAAHELKTPVAIMKANAQLLLSGGAQLGARQRSMAEAIDRGANRIDRIIQALLDISQLRMKTLTVRFVEVDLPALVARAVLRISPEADQSRVHLALGHPSPVRGDPHRLEWVMTHLLNNAIRYSPAGGPVDVRLERRDGRVVVSIEDKGIGIPEDRQARIFERFYRAHAGTPYDFGGVGVSLYISREIVRRHGGEMWFESRPGSGSTFHFSLPEGTSDAT